MKRLIHLLESSLDDTADALYIAVLVQQNTQITNNVVIQIK